MSSAVHIKFKETVTLAVWSEFCRKEKIEHHPCVIGGNIYYLHGDESGVQLRFGSGSYGGNSPFPEPASGVEVTVSTFQGGRAMPQVANLSAAILRAFPGSTYYPSPELEALMKMHGDFQLTMSCPECSEEHLLEDCPNR